MSISKNRAKCLVFYFLVVLLLSIDAATFADIIKIGFRANRGIEQGIEKWQPAFSHF